LALDGNEVRPTLRLRHQILKAKQIRALHVDLQVVWDAELSDE
jgi:hypothetical protein